jgi:starch phosphorylase
MEPQLANVFSILRQGVFVSNKILEPLLDTLTVGGDYYLISADFAAYLKTQELIDISFNDKTGWARKSIMCTAGMGKFSSDRSIQEYAKEIWKIEPCRVE